MKDNNKIELLIEAINNYGYSVMIRKIITENRSAWTPCNSDNLEDDLLSLSGRNERGILRKFVLYSRDINKDLHPNHGKYRIQVIQGGDGIMSHWSKDSLVCEDLEEGLEKILLDLQKNHVNFQTNRLKEILQHAEFSQFNLERAFEQDRDIVCTVNLEKRIVIIEEKQLAPPLVSYLNNVGYGYFPVRRIKDYISIGFSIYVRMKHSDLFN